MTRGYRNCIVCTRWRPVSDFDCKEGYITRRCKSCRRADRRNKYNNDANYRRKVKAAHREHQVIKRRERGVPVRPVGKHNNGKYGAGRIPNDAEQRNTAKKKWLGNLTPEQYREYRERENARKKADRRKK